MRTLDVSHLKPYEISSLTPLWWGQVCVAIIEGTMFSILIAAYFYVRMRVDVWPPPGDQFPHLLLPTLALIPLILSALPAYWASEAAKKNDRAGMIRNLILNLVLAAVCFVMRIFEWHSLNFNWQADAQGSYVWAFLGLHSFRFHRGCNVHAGPLDHHFERTVRRARAAGRPCRHGGLVLPRRDLDSYLRGHLLGSAHSREHAMNRDLALWTGILAGPLVWLISFEANFALVPWACIFEAKLALYLVSLVALAASGAAGFLAWHEWKVLGREMPGQGGDTLSRSRIMALGGVLLSAMCCLIIVAQAIPEFILGACQ